MPAGTLAEAARNYSPQPINYLNDVRTRQRTAPRFRQAVEAASPGVGNRPSSSLVIHKTFSPLSLEDPEQIDERRKQQKRSSSQCPDYQRQRDIRGSRVCNRKRRRNSAIRVNQAKCCIRHFDALFSESTIVVTLFNGRPARAICE